MLQFAERTGLASDAAPQRYLWTDAFAVCNFIGLARETGERRYADLAFRLIEQVHRVLGTYRSDDPRTGWISGLDAREGEEHPTGGGLRIGKPLPERGPLDPFDERLEWERDGQYFHYATKWMHALDQAARWTKEERYNTWARELAEVSHRAFTYSDDGRRWMVWKMSTDLSRPLVSSMGHHDPLDGFITCVELRTTASSLSTVAAGPSLEDAVADFAAIIEAQDFATADPLGLGGLLMDAARLAQLLKLGAFPDSDLLHRLLVGAVRGLSHYASHNDLREPPLRRLAFRELGLAIGLSAIEWIEIETTTTGALATNDVELQELIAALAGYATLRSEIQAFWLDPTHRSSPSWSEHLDINEVMLATSLLPSGFVVI
jgi:hypothetical protein